MTGEPVALGPFKKGMHNSAGSGEFIEDDELYEVVNLEVDTDGSLVNRPAINPMTYTITGSKDQVKVLGTYLPADGRRFLVIQAGGQVRIIDLATNTQAQLSNAGLSGASVVQYVNRLWVIPGPTDTVGNGGYFEALPSTSPTWTTVAAIPRGGTAFSYKERIFVVAGVTSTTNTSRFQFSALGDPTTWPGVNFVDVGTGDGEKLVYGLVLNNDIIFFKQHSTWRFTYESDPAKAVLSQINAAIGVPQANCAVAYDNNNVYVMHDNSVYELFNYTYTRISDKISMSQTTDGTLYAADLYGLTLYRDRLFVRYYANMYVYSLKTLTWSRWITDRKFSRLVVIPSTDIGLDIAYASSATTSKAGEVFFFRDDRVTGVGSVESFNCDITSKTYEFDKPFAFKRCFHWGVTIATSGNTTCQAIIPNSSKNPTWGEWSLLTWGQLASMTWGQETNVSYTTMVSPDKGGYARKFYKLDKSFRFVRTYFKLSTVAKANSTADSSVRIYDITVMIKLGERAVERVS